ncbi:MAG TPA: hypothetical protein VHN14_08520, partial [Kofleriaceae bacterium]|nr:hypothetical protein [Kofleriaceae bacterium]
MRRRGAAALAGSLLFLTTTAGAVVPHTAPRVAADTLTAMPPAHVTKPLRVERQVRWSSPPGAAWQHLA